MAISLDLPKHPLSRDLICPICTVKFLSIPVRRNAMPNEPDHIIEQHVCPTGHVYVTEIGKSEMLADW